MTIQNFDFSFAIEGGWHTGICPHCGERISIEHHGFDNSDWMNHCGHILCLNSIETWNNYLARYESKKYSQLPMSHFGNQVIIRRYMDDTSSIDDEGDEIES